MRAELSATRADKGLMARPHAPCFANDVNAQKHRAGRYILQFALRHPTIVLPAAMLYSILESYVDNFLQLLGGHSEFQNLNRDACSRTAINQIALHPVQ